MVLASIAMAGIRPLESNFGQSWSLLSTGAQFSVEKVTGSGRPGLVTDLRLAGACEKGKSVIWEMKWHQGLAGCRF